MTYTTEDIEDALEARGELLLTLDSDSYNTVELHLHDTSFDHDNGEVVLELADGTVGFMAESVESIAVHQQTTEELGI